MHKSGKLRRPVRSERLVEKRRRVLAIAAMLALAAAGVLALLFTGCGGSHTGPPPPPPAPSVAPLQAADVQKIVEAAVNSAGVDMVVAVVDRAGFVLAVYRTQNAPTTAMLTISRWHWPAPAHSSATIKRRSVRAPSAS